MVKYTTQILLQSINLIIRNYPIVGIIKYILYNRHA